MAAAAIDLPAALEALERRHGPNPKPAARSPFDWVIHENASYLVDDERRDRVFRAIRKKTALDPKRIERLSDAALDELLADGGMLAAARAEKVRRCAALALELGGGDLSRVLRLPLREARAALRRFPGIGEPGADWILLACGVATRPSVDSNGLRVMERLGVGNPHGGYASRYRSVVDALAGALPPLPAALARARVLLRRHGRVLCRRTSPLCGSCPLTECPSRVGTDPAARPRRG